MADFASREDSKYSIAFAKALTKCKTLVQFYDKDTAMCFGGNPQNRFLERVEILNPGSGYDDNNPPTVTVSNDGVSGATVKLIIKDGKIFNAVVTNPGIGVNCESAITITINGPNRGGSLKAVDGGVVRKNVNTVKLEYTDQYYNSGTPYPKVPPYPNIGAGEDIPFDDDFISGNNYKQMVGDHNGGEGESGAGKKLDDLPLCIATPLRIDVIPSIALMSYYKNEIPLVENSLEFKAYVFGGNNPNQQVVWGATSGTVETSESSVTRIINGKEYTVTLADTGIFKPNKREKSENITVRATMFSEESVYGGAIVRLIPQIMSNWPISEKGYIPGKEMNIEGWVFGGGSKQNLQITLTNNTDSGTSYNSVTGTLVVGNNENAKFLTLCMKDIVPAQFKPELEPLCINIYKKYISITTDINGNNIANDIPGEPRCNGETIQFYAWLKVDDKTEYEIYNFTKQNITNLATWSIEGNTLSETVITNGLLKFGVRDTVYQQGNILPNGHVFHTPNGGKITGINIVNGGTGYDLTATAATITASNGNIINLTLTFTSAGVINGITIVSGSDLGGFTPDSKIEILPPSGGTNPGTGFKYEIIIDNHFEIDNIATVFMRQCETGNIRILVSYGDVKESTT